MSIKSRIWSEVLSEREVWFWEVWDSDEPLSDDGVRILYGRGAEESREVAVEKAATRSAQVPQIKAAYDRVR